jgi:hypothetical protein
MALVAPTALRSMHGICTRPPTGIAGQPEVVLQTDLGGVLDLLDGPAEHLGESGGGHRAGGADLALATHLGSRDRRGLLEHHPDRGRGEQEVDHAVVVSPGEPACSSAARRG